MGPFFGQMVTRKGPMGLSQQSSGAILSTWAAHVAHLGGLSYVVMVLWLITTIRVAHCEHLGRLSLFVMVLQAYHNNPWDQFLALGPPILNTCVA